LGGIKLFSMTHIPYPFEPTLPTRYTFVSQGKTKIVKVVEFVPLRLKNMMNLGFGDLLPDGSLDDMAVSDNGDIRKVLSTVVHIIRHFTTLHPEVIIFFSGSTDERIRLYGRIMKMYYASFSKEYVIFGIIEKETENRAVAFDPTSHSEFLAFLIKRNN
jgi:hypothetical protein